MSVFTAAEIAYLRDQRLGRLATIGASGEPHVVPLRFRYNQELDALDLVGRFMGRSKKYRDAARNPEVAFVIDDVAGPGLPRGLEVRGQAEVFAGGGDQLLPNSDPEFIRITPRYIVSWGIDGEATRPNGRRVRA